MVLIASLEDLRELQQRRALPEMDAEVRLSESNIVCTCVCVCVRVCECVSVYDLFLQTIFRPISV